MFVEVSVMMDPGNRRRRGDTFALATPPRKVYYQPKNALEIAFEVSDQRTRFERMCDSFKQTFLHTPKPDEQDNFVAKNKERLSAVLSKYRERRIEFIESETEVCSCYGMLFR